MGPAGIENGRCWWGHRGGAVDEQDPECPPDVEDVCEGTDIPLAEAEEACTRHNNTDNFDWCALDYGA